MQHKPALFLLVVYRCHEIQLIRFLHTMPTPHLDLTLVDDQDADFIESVTF